MATQITNYQCPGCTGPLQFSPNTGKLECEYCGSSYTPAEVEAYYAEQNAEAEAAAAQAEATAAQAEAAAETEETAHQWGEDAQHMRAYLCPSCGAELICEETTAATACPYCGNPTIVPGQFSDERKPDYVIPFKVDKDAAMEALRGHYKGKPLLPGSFASENHIQEIKGVYVPFWLFDGRADADVVFEATRSHTVTTPRERIITTEYYEVRRRGNVEFKMVPVDGSRAMPDAHMDAIEPYNYEELKPFSLSYLPGFLADKYDVEAEESAKRADERCRNSAVAAMHSDVRGYQTCNVRHANVRLSREDARYALLPVWLLSTKWQDKNYLFAMNGQTGRLVGDLPVSRIRLALWFVAFFAVISAVCAMMMEVETALLVGGITAAILSFILLSSMKSAHQQTDAHQYIAAQGTNITFRNDRFVTRRVVRQPIQSANSGRGPGGPGR